MDKNQQLTTLFLRHFQGQPTHIAIAPGRVNLIGEHTDYNDGFVLPAAIRYDIRLAFRPRTDRTVRIFSVDFGEWTEFSLDQLAYDEASLWPNYLQGVAWSLQQSGLTLTGIDGVLAGDVPKASGLSSSAALEVACARAFLTAAGLEMAGPQLALAAQRAENQFVGVNSGIMDQFISVLGRANHALFIDCRTLDYELAPFPATAALVIGNTKASRSLAGSAYNQRRQECEEGVAILSRHLPGVKALRDVSSQQLESHQALLSETVYRRCRHVVSENERVHQTVALLAQGDLAGVGRLMRASHESLRVDYEVSSPALDAMVEAMASAPGCFGSRLTGAGFGGCAVALVAAGAEQVVTDAIFEHYPKSAKIWPEVYTSPPVDGAHVIPVGSDQ